MHIESSLPAYRRFRPSSICLEDLRTPGVRPYWPSSRIKTRKRTDTDVAFHKRCRLEIEDLVKSTWVYRQLRVFRAGIEGVISFLKRGFGLGRCVWRGFRSFKAYVHASVLACNLLIVARHALAACPRNLGG